MRAGTLAFQPPSVLGHQARRHLARSRRAPRTDTAARPCTLRRLSPPTCSLARRLPPQCSLAQLWLQPRPRLEDQPAAGAATAAAAAAMHHLGLFPASAPRITSATTVSACAAHNNDKTVTRLITTHIARSQMHARAHMHARTPRRIGAHNVCRNSNHAGSTPPYATQASDLPPRHCTPRCSLVPKGLPHLRP